MHIKNNKVLIPLSLIFMMMVLPHKPAFAEQYYDCANSSGCKLVADTKAQDEFTATRYPIVMAHGYNGWTRLYGVFDYWYDIPEALIQGGSKVYTTKTTAAQSTEYRGEELLQQIKVILTVTGKPKINLIGHSHGGLDARYVAATNPNVIASVTTVASPHQGSKMADWIIKMVVNGSAKSGYAPGEFNKRAQAAIDFFSRAALKVDQHSGMPEHVFKNEAVWSALISLSSDYMHHYFNPTYPQAVPQHYCAMPTDTKVNGVAYYSFSGVGIILNGVTNPLDPSDYLLMLTGLAFNKEPNDGLVSSCSSRLGYVIRDDYKMNHLDAINQILGMVAWQETDPVAIYRTHVNRLKQAEL